MCISDLKSLLAATVRQEVL